MGDTIAQPAQPSRTKRGILEFEISGRNKSIFTYEGINTVGRNKEAVVILKDVGGSQHHAQIIIINDCHYVADLKSTNGTLLNGNRLIPFQMYLIDENSTIEFSPIYIGKYKKITLNKTPHPSDKPSSDSQMTQVEDCFYNASTQVENHSQPSVPVPQIVDLVEEEVETVVVDKIVYIHEQETQIDLDIQPCCNRFKVNEYPMNVTVPTINEVATQLLTIEPVLGNIFADSQAFNEEISAKTSNSTKNCAKPMSDEISSTLQVSTTSEGDCTKDVKAEEVINTEGTQLVNDLINSDADFNDESFTDISGTISNLVNASAHSVETKRNGVKIADLSTQTICDTQCSVPNEKMVAETEASSLNLQLSETPSHDVDSDESVDMLQSETPPKQQEQNQAECEMDKQPSNNSTTTKQLSQTHKKASEDIFNSDDSDIGNKCQETNSKSRRSRFILSDSDDSQSGNFEDQHNDKPLPAPVPQNDTFSDCEDSYIKQASFGDYSCIPATQDDIGSEKNNFRLGFSHIQEEVTNISAITSNSTIIKDSSVEKSISDQNEASQNQLTLNDTEIIDFSFGNSKSSSQSIHTGTEKPNAVPITSETSLNDDDSLDFIAPTQVIEEPTKHCLHEEEIENVCNSDVITCKDHCVDLYAATQVVPCKSPNGANKSTEEIDFFAPTQRLETEMSSNENNHAFCAPTQSVSRFFKARKELLRKSKESEYEHVDFEAPTQKFFGKTRESEKNETAYEPDDDCFSASTQPLNRIAVSDETDSTENASLGADKTSETVDFEAATQPIPKQVASEEVSSMNNNVDQTENENAARVVQSHTEAETHKIDPEIESQLEVIFQTQNVVLSDHDQTRSRNPMANILDASSTQDVVDSLTGKNNLNEEFVEDRNGKRVEPTPNTKQSSQKARSSKGAMPRQKKSRSSVLKESKEAVNGVSNTSNSKTMLDFLQKHNDESAPVIKKTKLFNKLSLKKEDDRGMEVPVESANVASSSLSVNSPSANSTGVNKTLDATVKMNKRRLLDDESLGNVPSPLTKKGRLSSSNETEAKAESNVKEISNSTGRAKSGRKKREQSSRKTELRAPKGRTTRSVKHSAVADYESDEQPELIPKATASKADGPATRTSSRTKKAVNYSDSRTCIVSTSSSLSTMSSNDGDHLLSSINKADQRRTQDTKNLRLTAAVQVKTEDDVHKPLIVAAAEKERKAMKHKVLFTMLDDPKLKSIIKALGGSVVDDLKSSTVLVTLKVNRTLKLLAAVGASLPICSPDWLYACKKANTFLNPWDHLIQDVEAETEWKFAMSETLQKSKRGKIFTGYKFLVLVTLYAEVVKGAIEANGGRVIPRRLIDNNFIVVAAPSKKDKYEPYIQSKIKVVSAESILVGILRQELCFDEFLLK